VYGLETPTGENPQRGQCLSRDPTTWVGPTKEIGEGKPLGKSGKKGPTSATGEKGKQGNPGDPGKEKMQQRGWGNPG